MKNRSPSERASARHAAAKLCLSLVGTAALLIPATTLADIRTVTVYFDSAGPATGNGYANASVDVQYNVLSCPGGDIMVALRRVNGSVKASQDYWFEGQQVAASVPAPKTPSVMVRGTLVDGAKHVGNVRYAAMDTLGMGCYTGDTTVVAKLRDHVNANAPKQDIDAFLRRLRLQVDTTGTILRNDALEQSVKEQRRHAEARKRAEEAEAKKKAEAEARQKREEEARKKKEEEARKKQQAAQNGGGKFDKNATDADFWGGKPSGQGGQAAQQPAKPAHKPHYIRTQNGGYAVQGEDGRYRPVSEAEYRANVGGPSPQEQQQAAQQQQLNTMLAQQRQQQQNVQQAHAEVDRKLGLLQQSFYTGQVAANARDNIQNLSRLDGNYDSAEQLEADFRARLRALEDEMRTLEEADDANVDTVRQMYFNDEQSAGFGHAVAGLARMMKESEREEQREAARAQLERERQRVHAEIQQKRAQMVLDMRRSLLQRFPDGGVPLSSHKVESDVLYFFAYSLDKSAINQPSPQVSVANVFEVRRYGDGTWPFKQSISRELAKLAPGENTLMGYYSTREMADSVRASFLRLAQQSGFQVKHVEYKRVASAGGGSSSGGNDANFWGVPDKKPTNKPAAKQDDGGFWGVPPPKAK